MKLKGCLKQYIHFRVDFKRFCYLQIFFADFKLAVNLNLKVMNVNAWQITSPVTLSLYLTEQASSNIYYSTRNVRFFFYTRKAYFI